MGIEVRLFRSGLYFSTFEEVATLKLEPVVEKFEISSSEPRKDP